MKGSTQRSAKASAGSSDMRGRASSGSKTASNARSAMRQSVRAGADKMSDRRSSAAGTSERGPSRKLRS